MDASTILTSLFAGFLIRRADKAAAATVNFTKSTVLPRVSVLTRKATLATGRTLVKVGTKLTDSYTSK